VPAEPKAKNPLDDLPKSSFNLEEWKRVYSNQDTRKEALPWFFKNFDHEGFSVWRFDFKYNEELTQIFMSANQVSIHSPFCVPSRRKDFADTHSFLRSAASSAASRHRGNT
jgi:Elongation factor 1 gamma, conserved domain